MAALTEGKGVRLTPVRVTGLHNLEDAISIILTRLYAGFLLPDKPVTKKHIPKAERNAEIIARYTAGEGISELARQQLLILRRHQKRGPTITHSEKLVLLTLVERLHQLADFQKAQFEQLILIFKPDALLRWHRELVRRKWDLQQSAQARRAIAHRTATH